MKTASMQHPCYSAAHCSARSEIKRTETGLYYQNVV